MFPNGLKCICVEAVGGVLRLGMMLRIGGAIGQCVVLVGFLRIRVRTDLLNSIFNCVHGKCKGGGGGDLVGYFVAHA